MKKIVFFSFLFLFILVSLSSAIEKSATSVVVDGLSIKELEGVSFTILFREARKEDEGSLKIDGKLLTKVPSSFLDRAHKSNGMFDIEITNEMPVKDAEAEILTFKDCKIKSVSKGAEHNVYRWEAEKLE